MTGGGGPRLSQATLEALPGEVGRPAYDRSALRTGIVHLGIGAFHRAHQAVYTDDVLAAGDHAWAIRGASLRSPDMRDALAPQDGLYALDVRDADREELRVIGSILDVLVAPEHPEALLSAMSDPGVRIVSLTVTEKGYCHRPADGELDETHPDIVHDLAHPGAPRSAPGFIVEALRRRRVAGDAPFTVLSCDNLPANGRTAQRVLSRLAALRDPELGRFVQNELACPCTMVDRIVPATTDADRARVTGLLGVEDRWPVLAEPFSQWVIEDHFPSGRPDWAAAGATFAPDVEPFELMKLRLLNASHSTMAYLGCLAGYGTVSEAVADPDLARLVRDLMDEEVTPTLPHLPGFDLEGYKDSLMARFRNPALRHLTAQIAMDGSQKLPQRLLGPARDRLRAGASIDRIAIAVAAWIRYVSGPDEQGRAIAVRDPLAEDLAKRARAAGSDAARLCDAVLGVRAVFGDDLPSEPRFRGPVEAALRSLLSLGSAATVRAAVQARGPA
ncbi:MAG: mannitol dehydrogenase [Enterovirga sp.]|nr:mannitol dehydrogenase [Enterovirga sp.]